MFAPYKTETPDAPVKAGKYEVSWDGLIAWLKTKNSSATYSYMDCSGGCLLGQFYAAAGHPWEEGGNDLWLRESFGFGPMSAQEPHTFGGALARSTAIRARTA